MLSFSQQKTPTLFAGAGVLLAAGAVALFNLFPGARTAGLCAVILAGVLFWLSGVNGKLGHRRVGWLGTPLDLPILLLLVQIGVSFWATALPDKTWVAVGQLAAGLVAYYAIVNWSRDRTRLWWTVAALIALGLGLALIAPFAVDWFRERKTFLPPALYDYLPLLLSDSVHPNVMAGALATLLPLPLALALAIPMTSRRQSWLRGTLLLVCLLEISVLILTKSRGGYIALGVGLWLTLWLSGRRRWATALIIVAALAVAWLATQPLAETTEGLDPTQAVLDASSWAFRQQVWHTAIQVVSDFPFTGVGAGTFNDVAALLYGFYSPNNPGAHNLFIQAGVDLGLLGLISFLAILILVLWAAFQAYRLLDSPQDRVLQAVAIGGLSGIVATIAHGLVDTHTWGSKGAFIPWMVMGLIIALVGLALVRTSSLPNREESASP
jgi:putative inorganic carbon (HCO3(-)) transporter